MCSAISPSLGTCRGSNRLLCLVGSRIRLSFAFTAVPDFKVVFLRKKTYTQPGKKNDPSADYDLLAGSSWQQDALSSGYVPIPLVRILFLGKLVGRTKAEFPAGTAYTHGRPALANDDGYGKINTIFHGSNSVDRVDTKEAALCGYC